MSKRKSSLYILPACTINNRHPENFPPIIHPEDNPLTEEGVELGRHLFWENKLSGNNSIACANCHLPQYAFSDPNKFSIGIHGDSGKRNSMVLQNLAWSENFFGMADP